MNIPTVGPEISFGLDDQIKFIAAGVSGTQAGFMTGTGSFTFLPGAVLVTTTTFHTYQMRKFGADSVVLWVDGVRRLSRTYSTFPARLAGSSHGFYFGPLGTGAGAVSAVGNSSTWDWVIYEIGVTQP
jgi:hypothetical protein